MELDRHADPNSVKIALSLGIEARIGRALYFSRATIPWGDGPLFHHFGLYAYRRDALVRFVNAEPTILETRERLEQLRALEVGMRIDVALIGKVLREINTPEDLEREWALLSQAKG
jgi:3-deoxy-manno-octulosonate cytidylyltransferase (CMP-KDO synthetase)